MTTKLTQPVQRRSVTLSEHMRFNLTRAERLSLEARAAEEDRSLASVVRRAVLAYLAVP